MKIVRIGHGSAECPPADVVGAKAANLARMARLGLPVPPAFVLPIELCAAIVSGDKGTAEVLSRGLAEGVEFLEEASGLRFGDRRRPLLLSVRSGAARSMPGMLDTVLNVGCTIAAVHGLVRMTGNPRFAWDCRCRFLESYADVVLGADDALFAGPLAETLAAERLGKEARLDGEAFERLAAAYQQAIGDDELPEDPMEQLEAAAHAVYRSWNSDRAQTYRRLEHLDDLAGTAVTIQQMVFGNRGPMSAAGVAFSRDPSTGAAQPVIDALFESQGEDVVSGSRTPDTEQAIIRTSPAVALQLRQTLTSLEKEFGDVQDVEFTIEDGKLWILQTRSAKRTPQAALRLAIDFVNEGLITKSDALKRLQGVNLDVLAHQRLVDVHAPDARGTGASAGVAVGRIAFETASAERLAKTGDPVILARPDTSTSDVAGFSISAGIVTAVGGRTAHAALVARQMGKPCVVGCAAIEFDIANHRARISGTDIREGDWISIDGEEGSIYLGRHTIAIVRPAEDLAEVERWRSLTIPTRDHDDSPDRQIGVAASAQQ